VKRLGCGVVLLSVLYSAAGAQNGLAFARAGHLLRGVNLSNWYSQTDNNDYSAAHLAGYMTAADFELIRDLGFDHVRLSINPEPLLGDKEVLPTS